MPTDVEAEITGNVWKIERKPGESVEQFVAITILDKDALGARNHPRRRFAARVFGKMGRGMEKTFPVPLIELVVSQH